MKRIGIILSQPPAYSETFLNSKFKGLIDAGFEVTIFSQAKDKGNYFFNHIPAYPASGLGLLKNIIPVFVQLLFKAGKSTLKYIQLARKEGQSWSAAIKGCYINAHILLHPQDHIHFEFSALAVKREFLAKAMGAKLSVSIRGFDIAIYPLKNPGCFNSLWKYLDTLHSISDDLTLLARELGLRNETPVVKITPAIETSKFIIKKDHGVLHSIPQLITVARVHWKKGLNYQISAAHQLKQKGINFEWHLIGDGPEMDYIKFMVNDLDLHQQVIVHGRLTHEQVAEKLASSDIYIQYSVQEGFCNAVLEAQSAGLLTIVSNAEGLSENVSDKETGFVVAKRRSELLAKKIMEVLAMSDSERIAMTDHASARVKKTFDIKDQTKQFIEFYK